MSKDVNREVYEMHPFKLSERFKSGNYVIGWYGLKEDIKWRNETQDISVSDSCNGKTTKIRILKGALWSKDSFEKGEEVLVYIDTKGAGINIEGEVCCIVTESFFRNYVSDDDTIRDLSRIKKVFSAPENLGTLAMAFMDGGKRADEMEKIPEAVEQSSQLEELYKIVEPYLLPEQRSACKLWKSKGLSISSNHNLEKLKYILNISPTAPYRDREKITYESIMETFNKRIVGFDQMKKTIAVCLAENQKKNAKRGINILIHGLPGTGKTDLWASAIAEALHLNLKVVNLGDKGSSVSLYGCESPYENSEPGILAKYFFRIKTSESVILWDECDKLARIGEDRGKDGHVMEGLIPVLDKTRRVLSDCFLDEVPISMENTINIFTGNRIQNFPFELLNRMDMVFSTTPFDEKLLMEILCRNLPIIEAEYNLKSGWIQKKALKHLARYRGDFGARDVLSNLKIMAAFCRDHKGAVITERTVDRIMPKAVDMNNATIRFHFNEDKYPKEQKDAILETITRRISAENLSKQESRALDLKVEHLTKLIPDKDVKFDPDCFFERVNSKIWGQDEVKNKIAAVLYAAEQTGQHPEPIVLVGPPGVGKTLLIESIAHASRRKYIRIQMSGVKDSDYLLGHIPEQVSANAGKIAREMAKAETTAPVLHLDELDKISRETEHCLFEIFDGKVHDRFLDFDIDLSHAQIVCTANNMSEIHPALLSRMKIIHVSGYTAAEKKHICKKHLLPEITKNLKIEMDETVVDEILDYFKNNCGVRSLKHGLKTVVDNCLLEQRKFEKVRIHKEDVTRILGAKEYVYLADNIPGCVNGLATYGDSCGLVMPIRVTLLKNPNGEKRITGLPEASIRESITLAETWLEKYEIYLDKYHINFSPGGVKKDGPSCGLAIALALLSAATGISVENVAFTGEIDGNKVLPIGGLKLKVQGAASAGIKKVYAPVGSRDQIVTEQFEDIEICYVETIDEVVKDLFPNVVNVKNRDLKKVCK